ncbi:MAG: alpha-1,4-glucan--maltose-1-phosphate maltosyltransferase [Elusimicrobia bacterium GWA2_69_24]|nr:MAG: alpha-1,4-glucan--maltose-1-phosphate maltosyltransferase [Elusimicrobia bacterium GWA2_69_24]
MAAASGEVRRAVIERVLPEVDAGRFPIKRTVGETVRVKAHAFADGHDELACVLLHRHESQKVWFEAPMQPLGNDVWAAEFSVSELGRYFYTVQAWVDPFRTWQRDLRKRLDAGQDVAIDLKIGADLIDAAARRVPAAVGKRLRAWAGELRLGGGPAAAARSGERMTDGAFKGGGPMAAAERAFDPELSAFIEKHPDKKKTPYGRELPVWVDREKARFSAWYEMFPRSASPEPGRHGTFRDCIARLPYLADMGFDLVYLPPIHPIGTTRRKGRNNSLACAADDPGSPWAIGSAEGGHKSVHPGLGTLEDFRELVSKARALGIDVALDIAFQCSPDHPYLREHPEWFRSRPDGTVQYAENPPKKYEDIYPFDFASGQSGELWLELRSIFFFWIEQGVRVFRVDNPHTKPFAFWEWIIAEVRREHPDVIFLSEAFTRPKIMYRLAKLGFTQSYNYFPWRTAKQELAEYFTELTRTEVREFFRPSLWTNTPDILISYLQNGGRPAFIIRSLLASTLGASYGIYGPAFELCDNRAKTPGQEEYLDSEKYEVRYWNLRDPLSIQWLLTRLNAIRRENPALQSDWSLRFVPVDNDRILCYSKQSGENLLVMAVNLDPHWTQSGWVDLPLAEFGLNETETYEVHDLLTDLRFRWHGPHNFVELRHEAGIPAHVLRIERIRK